MVQDFQQKQLQVRNARRQRRPIGPDAPPTSAASQVGPTDVGTVTTAAKVLARLHEDDLLGVRFALKARNSLTAL